MRSWRTEDGQVLVEGPSAANEISSAEPIRTPADEPVVDAHVYYLLAASGEVRAVYENLTGAIEDELYGLTHQVVGDALYSHWTSYYYGARRSTTQRRELTGLVELPAESEPAEDAVSSAVTAFRRRQSRPFVAYQEHEVAVRASFAEAMLSFPEEGPLDLEFGYDDGPVVRHHTGLVVWRPGSWPYRGKDLYVVLNEVYMRRFGDRLAIRLRNEPWWFWAADE